VTKPEYLRTENDGGTDEHRDVSRGVRKFRQLIGEIIFTNAIAIRGFG
jgi:hypothetical protein